MGRKKLNTIEKALKTWYSSDHELYRNPTHPVLKLAGECGELVDLYAKHVYKPDFDWRERLEGELGDIWYYLRILFWMTDEEIPAKRRFSVSSLQTELTEMNFRAAQLLRAYDQWGFYNIWNLEDTLQRFYAILEILEITIEELTESNYKKLNSEPTHHGWSRT